MFTMQRNSPEEVRLGPWVVTSIVHVKGDRNPQPHLMMMHKTENKYEVGKLRDWKEAKQRQLRAILNKLTPENFDDLFEQMIDMDIEDADTLRGVVAQIFDRAIMEPTFCEMYAEFYYYLSQQSPVFMDDNGKMITLKRLLVNKCQEEFERKERDHEEASKIDVVKQSEVESEEKRIKARKRMLGNIRLIGELYKVKILPEKIIHHCIQELLCPNQNPDEEDVEALCVLMSTTGETLDDHPKTKKILDIYFEKMENLSNDTKLSLRVRFMVKDTIDLRENKWQLRRKVEGPKKIEEVHRDAALEQQAQAIRLGDISSSIPREDLIPRFDPDRFSGQAAYYQSSAQEQSINYGGRNLGNSDHNLNGSSSTQNTPTEMWLEESMREFSRTANKVCRFVHLLCILFFVLFFRILVCFVLKNFLFFLFLFFF